MKNINFGNLLLSFLFIFPLFMHAYLGIYMVVLGEEYELQFGSLFSDDQFLLIYLFQIMC